MRTFVRVAQEGSFTAAAEILNTSPPGVSRAIAALESHLRARLFNRSTRRVVLTETGKQYLARCAQILALVDDAEGQAADAQLRPMGHLRVHSSASLGQSYIVPAIVQYQRAFPTVAVGLTLSQHTPDLIEDGYDVTIQASVLELPDSSLVAHKLGTVYSVLCAAPEYLQVNGSPTSPSELQTHSCFQPLSSAFPRDRWLLEGPDGVEKLSLAEPSLTINVAEALGVALREGIGIGALPMSTAAPAFRDRSLVRVLPEYRLQGLKLYAMYASRQYLDAKVKTFVDFIRDAVPQRLEEDIAQLR
ncbi:Transcriptional regulator [Paraburkholderia piptadeniae]|uniref:Transcriptional regulator n=2 Tax=Paraburkholderia piptadeniae TaxID=1701573 RepID=A0A1N7S2W0_9BURK|nr:Transcriptional regulator [Paraburkholderia piptadeniae]